MRLMLAGCEYSGTTTLSCAIAKWARENMGERIGFHDHWKLPHINHPPIQAQAELERRVAQARSLRDATPQAAATILRELDLGSRQIQDTLRSQLSDNSLSPLEINRMRLGLLSVLRGRRTGAVHPLFTLQHPVWRTLRSFSTFASMARAV